MRKLDESKGRMLQIEEGIKTRTRTNEMRRRRRKTK
jgi:hypothetical protein